MPLSSVLSPVSLAACTRVDSLFSPRFIPLLSLSLHCHRLQLSILHHPHKLPPVAMETHGTTSTYAGVYYEGYKVLSSHQSQEAQELFRITLDEARLFLSQRRDSNALVKVVMLVYIHSYSSVWLVWDCTPEVDVVYTLLHSTVLPTTVVCPVPLVDEQWLEPKHLINNNFWRAYPFEEGCWPAFYILCYILISIHKWKSALLPSL